MKKIELNKGKRFYLLGIGGISMSALAIFLKEKGNVVSGSDAMLSDAVEELYNHGIDVDFSINEEKIKNADYVVVSSAIKEENKFLKLAKKLKKSIYTRGQLLGAAASQFEKVIAVAGSHGKTTTTALIFEVLKSAGKDPTLHLGGFRSADKKNFHLGGKEFFVTEACEYYDNFLNLYPYIAVVTNVEKEHMDYFKTFERQLESFERFKLQSKCVVEGNGNFIAKYIRHNSKGQLSFNLCKDGKKIMRLKLKICEEVNTQNCISAYRVCKFLGLSDEEIKIGLESFEGVKTRFEKVTCKRFDNVLCDYSHHPTEIEKAIFSAKKIFKNKKLIVVFQPHTFSRTKDLLGDFLRVLKTVDVPILYKTYSAREKEEDGLSAKSLALSLLEYNANTLYADCYEELLAALENFDRKSVIMFVGAGDLPSILHKKNFLS